MGKIRAWGWPGCCSWPFGQPPEKAYGYRATSWVGTKGDIVPGAFSRSAQQLVQQLHVSSMFYRLLNTLSCQGNACLMTSSWHASTPLWKVTPFQSWTSWSAACYSEKHPSLDHLSAQIAPAACLMFQAKTRTLCLTPSKLTLDTSWLSVMLRPPGRDLVGRTWNDMNIEDHITIILIYIHIYIYQYYIYNIYIYRWIVHSNQITFKTLLFKSSRIQYHGLSIWRTILT